MIQGGKFGQGFASSFFTKRFSGKIAGALGSHRFGGAIAAALFGGTASRLGGGKFSNGAQTAAIQYLFNEVDKGLKEAQRDSVVKEYLPEGSHRPCSGLECLARLWHGSQASGHAQDAFPDVVGEANNAVDAYRHAYWSYKRADSLGPDVARQIVNHHDFNNLTVDQYPIADLKMDFHNNNFGISLQQTLPGVSNEVLDINIKASIKLNILMVSPY